MKPTAAITVATTGDMETDSTTIKMGVDENNLEHLLMLLTDLYSDQIGAVIREYSTNAHDSHKEAGTSRPIEITLPNLMSPFFTVRDYGVGLSLDEVTNVYSKYGSSTKRDSNDYNGMLGLGCKSALTYTNQFTVKSVKDGEKITVLVARAGSSATMEVVDKIAGVNEPNGVEISVPVKATDHADFSKKAARFFSFWPKGSVLLDGTAPEPVVLKMVTPTIGTCNAQFGSDIVVMGNVAYPVERRLYSGDRPYSNQFDVVAYVPIGEVAFTPSREALMYTKHTEATIARLKQEFATSIRQSIIDDINSQPTHAQAFSTMQEWSARFASLMPSPVTYKGQNLPEFFEFDYARWETDHSYHAFRTGNKKIDASRLVKSIVIYNWPGLKSLSKIHKDKIKQYRRDNGISANYIIFTSSPQGAPWIAPERVVDWDVIRKIVLPGMGGPAQPRKKPTIDIYNANGYTETVALDANKGIVYVSPTARLGAAVVKQFYAAFPNMQVVSLGENRWDKFKRENPTAVPMRDFVRAEYTTTRDALTPMDLKHLGMSAYDKRRLDYLDESLVKDPELVESIQIAKGIHKSVAVDQYHAVVNLCHRLGMYSIVQDLPTVPSVTVKYPLLPSEAHDTLKQKHALTYINAVFAATV